MIDIGSYAWFVAGAFGLIVVPGPDFILVLSRAVAGGARAGLAAAAGIATGLVAHTLVAAAGVTALLLGSETAFGVVRVIGAVYLVYLGVRTLLGRGALISRRDVDAEIASGSAAGHGSAAASGDAAAAEAWTEARAEAEEDRGARPGVAAGRAGGGSVARAYREGVLTNLLNPKVGLTFVAYMPQFFGAVSGPAWVKGAVLGGTICVVAWGWFSLVSAGAGLVRRWLVDSRWAQAVLRYGFAALLIGFGVRLAVEGRPLAADGGSDVGVRGLPEDGEREDGRASGPPADRDAAVAEAEVRQTGVRGMPVGRA